MNAAQRYLPEAIALQAALDAERPDDLFARAVALRHEGHGRVITYSRKVFIPLTRLCRDVCGYCTFATTPRRAGTAFLSPEEVLSIARAGRDAGCREALFTLGDKPELRYAAARDALKALGYATTVEYLAAMCERVVRETGLLPHVNAGVMEEDEIKALRRVSISQGIMLETISPRLSEPGGPHYGSPDKHPDMRMAMMETAGRLRVPFTSGILIGIGETRTERLQSLLALRDLHARHGHVQEIIIQNFRAKADTRMAGSDEPGMADLMWTAAAARVILGPSMNIQVPPNLSYSSYPDLLKAGINDWGGVSPVTVDHVNPEAPWPQIEALEKATAAAGLELAGRLAVYPDYALTSGVWQHPEMARRVLADIDFAGLVRTDGWSVGVDAPLPPDVPAARNRDGDVDAIIVRAMRGDRLDENAIVTLFSARGSAVDDICAAANALRRQVSGEVVRYVVNRNINYTNVCTYRCTFCAFSKGKGTEALRGPAYDLAFDEIARRVGEAWDRGATEVCMQGGINPHYTGNTYLEIVRTVKTAVPQMHVHAFSPLEVT